MLWKLSIFSHCFFVNEDFFFVFVSHQKIIFSFAHTRNCDDENQFISILMLTPFTISSNRSRSHFNLHHSTRSTAHTCLESEQLYFARWIEKCHTYMKMMMIQFANAWKRREFNIWKILHMSCTVKATSRWSLGVENSSFCHQKSSSWSGLTVATKSA